MLSVLPETLDSGFECKRDRVLLDRVPVLGVELTS